MLAITILLLVLVGGAALAGWLTRALQGFKADSDAALAARNAEVGRQLEGITATMDRRLGELDTKVDRRMEHASKQTNAIHKQLGDVGRATTLLAEHAKELGQLQQVLRPPKARGGFGELLLGNLLRDRLPPEAYSLQYGFKSGERVDAVIRVDRLPPPPPQFPPPTPATPSSRSTTSSGSSTRRRARSVSCTRRRSRATSRVTLTRSPPSTSGPTREPTTLRLCISRRRRSTTS